ncbi:MAG: septal ring lytic transglycosylase RlpA family protein [bacterium]
MPRSKERLTKVLLDLPKEVISAEEILRHRVQTFLRVALATIFIWLGSLLSFGATAFANTVSKDQPSKSKTSQRQRQHYRSHRHSTAPNLSMVGTASWYGHGFHNRKTASGKKFDQNSFVAAHRTLPFGTLVKVTNTLNNKSCIVEITDRGPYVKHRIIDVSRGAATELGFTSSGTAHVTLEVVAPITLTALNSERNHFHVSDVLKSPVMAVR